jgi:4-amino-4-deoxy-L-arabinose transferase-like glycosyltransferase
MKTRALRLTLREGLSLKEGSVIWLGAILILYLLLALGYGMIVPLFEAPDEQLHYFTVEYIAREGRLPVARPDSLARQEAAQPPLYYLLGALLIAPVGAEDAAGQLWLNPLSDPGSGRGDGDASPPLNANAFVHTAAEGWPWEGYVLAAHLLRIMSAVIGLCTLLVIHAAGRLLWPERPGNALLATALVAFLPQYAFLHGAINNDTLIIFFSTLALWQLLRIMNNGPLVNGTMNNQTMNNEQWGVRHSQAMNSSPTIHNSQLLFLGFTIGLAMLSKTAGLLLLAFAAGYVGLLTWAYGGARGRVRRTGRAVALIIFPALAVAGWWLWRNWVLYDDVTAASQFVALAGGVRPFTLRQVWGEMDRVLLSTFAYFGWMNVRAPNWIYGVWGAIVLAAVLGWLLGWLRGRGAALVGEYSATTLEQGSGGAGERRWVQRGSKGDAWVNSPLSTLHSPLPYAVMLGGWFLLVFLGWLQFMLQTPADQGRLLFPALLPLTLAVTAGLARWPRPWTQIAVTLLVLLTSVYCLVAVIRPAYAVPRAVASLPAEATPLDIEIAPGLELVGATIETAAVRPDEWTWVTLYWRASERIPAGEAPIVQLDLFGRDFHLAGRQVAYHGRGLYPPSLWPLSSIIADQTAVRLYPWAETPGRGWLSVSLVTAEGEPWPGASDEGEPVGEIKLAPAVWGEQTGEPLARLGEGIELAAVEITPRRARPGDAVEVSLRWQVSAAPGTHLHTFVHLGDPGRPPLAQHDGPPLAGEYPTGLWEAGEVIEDKATLNLPADLPPGEYPLSVGLYAPESGARLPVLVEGAKQPNDIYPAGWINIE